MKSFKRDDKHRPLSVDPATNFETVEVREFHCRECQSLRDEALLLIKVFRKAWPNMCVACGARGGWEDKSDVAEENIGFFACPDCLGQGKCPRCGTQVMESSESYAQYLVCPVCGWDEHDPQAEPEMPLCICGDEE